MPITDSTSAEAMDVWLRDAGRIWGRKLLVVEPPTPLMGHIAFGVIDRGTNVLQVRPSTLCPHNCIFCSVDAGPESRTRQAEFQVDPDHLVEWVETVAKWKGGGVEALLDGVGEPLTHPRIMDIISSFSESPWVDRVALETHGGFLTKKLAERLADAGLDRLNLSVDTLDPEKAKLLTGVPWYDVKRVMEVARYLLEETNVDVVFTPVVVPGVNEEDMKDLIEWARSHGAGEKSGWPTGILIQKMEAHKYGRKPKRIRPWSWQRFYRWLRRLEEEMGYRLIVEPGEIGIRRAPRVPEPYKPGEEVLVEVIGPGWHKREVLAVDNVNDRVMALYCRRPCGKGRVVARIARSRDNIIVAIR